MGTRRWQDIEHKASPEERERADREVREEYDRMGYADFRKAQELTRTDLASRLDVDESGLAMLEEKFDLYLCTLEEHVRALGGRLKFSAVFPKLSFNLVPLPPIHRAGQTALDMHPAALAARTKKILASPE